MMPLPDKDNEFDDLIKAAADKYQASGAKPEWEHMKGLLDKHLPVKKDPRRRLFILFFLLLLLSGGGYLYFKSNNRPGSSPGTNEQHAVVAPTNDSDTSKTTATGTRDRDTITKAKLSGKPVLKDEENTDSQTNTAINGTSRGRYKLMGKHTVHTSAGEVTEDTQPAQTNAKDIAANKDESADEPNDKNGPWPSKNEKTDTGQFKKTDKVNPLADSLNTESKPSPGTKDTVENKLKKNDKKRKHPFELSLLYAPELTTVGFSKWDKPGGNYGLLVGYAVSNNIIIQSGLVRSRKNYSVKGKDFTLDYPLSGNHTLNQVDGYCMMYEIPLGIKSFILKGKKYNFFYTAGISSYIMTSEFYTYNIGTNTGSYDKDVTYHTQKNYWFSVAGASVGVERKITNTLDFSVSPFIKIPFSGMGEGKLKLTGVGVNFMLTYKP